MHILPTPILCPNDKEVDVVVLDNLLILVQKPMWRSLYWPDLSWSSLLLQRSLAFTISSQSTYFLFSMDMLIPTCSQLTVVSENSVCSFMFFYMPSHISGRPSHKYMQRHLTVLQTFAVMPAEHNQEPKSKPFFFFSVLMIFQISSPLFSSLSTVDFIVNKKLTEDPLWLAHIWHYYNSILTHC